VHCDECSPGLIFSDTFVSHCCLRECRAVRISSLVQKRPLFEMVVTRPQTSLNCIAVFLGCWDYWHQNVELKGVASVLILWTKKGSGFVGSFVQLYQYFEFPSVLWHSFSLLLWRPYVIEQAIIFLPCGFFLSFFFFFSSPNLSRHRLDVCHTVLPHMVWP